jgi:hypothetical protein
VYAQRPDRVVQPQLVERDDAEHDQHAGDEADDDRPQGVIWSAPAVIPTSPARMPFRAIDRSGLPNTTLDVSRRPARRRRRPAWS